MLSLDAALEDSSEDTPAERDETSKESRRDSLQKTIETVRARREALARETSATRRAVETAAAYTKNKYINKSIWIISKSYKSLKSLADSNNSRKT